MITADDVKFHTPPDADHHWAEITHIAFQIPEHDLNCAIYLVAKAGAGVMVCEVIVFNTLSLDRREVLYFDAEHHLPLPADFSDFTLPNGFSLKAVNPPRDYRVDYVGTDDTEFHVDVTGLMEPYDIHDPTMCPTAVPVVAGDERVRRAGFGAAYTAHYDMSVRIRGTLKVHGRTFEVDCVDTMETFHLGHGYVLENGEVSGLKSGAMTARREGSLAVEYTVEVVDRTDRSHTFTGTARSAHNWVCYQALQINDALCEWRSGSGQVGYGIHQESFPLNLMARHENSPARKRLAAVPGGYRLIGQGQNVFNADEVEGPVRWLETPEDVIDFVNGEEAEDTIVISRGGTTTFMAPALSNGVKGLITLNGGRESHLGIISREFGIPCLMSVAFTEGVTLPTGEVVPADGSIVRLQADGSTGSVLLRADGQAAGSNSCCRRRAAAVAWDRGSGSGGAVER